MTPARRIAPAEVPGLAARRIAADILDNVLRRQRPLDAELDGAEQHPGLFDAVLRRVAGEGRDVIAALDPVSLDTPQWLFARWQRNYGADTARAIALAHSHEPPLDLTVKADAESWAQRLRGRVLPTGSIRTATQGQVSLLPGYHEGAWWVQDAAAGLPARLFGEVAGKSVADLCAAPGGKTAQLAHAGARVTAVDRSTNRLVRVRDNLMRLGLSAHMVAADATEWQGGPFDAVLVDAPCSSTGTIRRHPDVGWLKSEADLAQLIGLQGRLLDRAVCLTKPGGTLVYCVCSLEPEEGEQQIEALLAREPSLRHKPIGPEEIPGIAEFLSSKGDLRTLPSHWGDPDP